jgi:hypothetical protein
MNRLVALTTCIVLVGGCQSSKSLATTVDELLRAGRYAAAADEVRAGVPGLVRSRNVGELEDLSDTLNGYLRSADPAVDTARVHDVAETGARAYFGELVANASQLPLDNLCEAIVASQSPPLDPNQSLLRWLENRERLENAKDYCVLLQLVG